jgi:hypothetical protein
VFGIGNGNDMVGWLEGSNGNSGHHYIGGTHWSNYGGASGVNTVSEFNYNGGSIGATYYHRLIASGTSWEFYAYTNVERTQLEHSYTYTSAPSADTMTELVSIQYVHTQYAGTTKVADVVFCDGLTSEATCTAFGTSYHYELDVAEDSLALTVDESGNAKISARDPAVAPSYPTITITKDTTYDGTPQNTPVTIETSVANLGSSWDFSGSDYYDIGGTSTFNWLHDGSTDHTVSFWMQDNNNGGGRDYVLSSMVESGAAKGFSIFHEDGRMMWMIYNGQTSAGCTCGLQNTFPQDNDWHHWAFVFDGDGTHVVEMFLDGTSLGTATLGTLSSGNADNVMQFPKKYHRGTSQLHEFHLHQTQTPNDANHYLVGMYFVIHRYNQPMSDHCISSTSFYHLHGILRTL